MAGDRAQEVVRGLAAEAFGEWAMARVDPAWAGSAIDHEPTRLFLTEVGLPVQMASVFVLDDRFWGVPREADGRVCLGWLAHNEVYLVPSSGEVVTFREDGSP